MNRFGGCSPESIAAADGSLHMVIGPERFRAEIAPSAAANRLLSPMRLTIKTDYTDLDPMSQALCIHDPGRMGSSPDTKGETIYCGWRSSGTPATDNPVA